VGVCEGSGNELTQVVCPQTLTAYKFVSVDPHPTETNRPGLTCPNANKLFEAKLFVVRLFYSSSWITRPLLTILTGRPSGV
jgi:hypothetical protein